MKKCKACQTEIDDKATKCPHCQSDLRPWPKKHPILTGIVAFIALVIILGATSGNKSNTQTVQQPTGQTTENTASQNPTPTPQPQKETLTISKSTVKTLGGGIIEVLGEAKNNDTTKHSATLKATFYDKDGNILGSAVGALNDVAPGDTKTFTLMSTDSVTGYKTMKVQVDTLL